MTGKRIGYVRVSTIDQNPERQLEGIELDKKFTDYASGGTIHRPQLEAMLDYVREDDIIYVHALDRLARNVKDLQQLIDLLKEKKVQINFVKENLNFGSKSNPMSNFLLIIIGAVAEFEHSLIRERFLEGIALAKKQGKYRGAKSKFTKELKERLINLMKNTRKNKNELAKELKISRGTLYTYLEKIEEKDG